ncbi:MAG: T9SS type A sorting domain-containing protein [Balneolaceae bacterium]|nr:T9SS type A sorting domain-containing protein [Balneolaceae bacterium]
MTYNLYKSSGKFILSLLFLFLLQYNPVSAQENFNRIHSFAPLNSPHNSPSPVSGTLNIIAVMVEFQPDSNRFTSGNGTFEPGSLPYLENPGTSVDALPHNRAYFEAHLEFVKNYFQDQSNGRLQINYEVLPTVYRLDNEMAHYSPIGEDPDLSPLGTLVHDVWELVSQDGNLQLNLDQIANTAFVIFHAGIGRDIELTGTSLDKTPQDIPSVYLSTNALQNLLNDPTFSGFQIDNGNILVTNSLILPRTLSRAGEDVTGQQFVLPLSSNGMITAQIASHLGLPDLFNTDTGQSGIGRFGLMDGAGIFAYNGLFPPGLSAWEKIYLGWAEPFEIQGEIPASFTLPASSFHQNQAIAKLPISNSEYFLIENRHRDPHSAGLSITIRRPDGSETVQTFTNQDEDFVNQATGFDELLEPGVVTNVSNFDFALPGGFDEGNTDSPERDLNGGILIWHIDESVINQKLGTSGINSIPSRRGVRLVEADGAQDIGKPTQIGLGQNESNGSAFDFWWSGNNATVITPNDSLVLYQNRFGPDTTPNNNSNSGAPSYFELYEFSDNLPYASFNIRPVNPFSNIYSVFDERSDITISTYNETDNDYSKRYPLALQPISLSNNNLILIPGKDGIQFYDLNSKTIHPFAPEVNSLQQPFIDSNRSIFTISENPWNRSGLIDTKMYSLETDEAEQIWEFSAPPNSGFISSSHNSLLDIDGTRFRADLQNLELIENDEPSQFSETVRGVQSKIVNNQLMIISNGNTITHNLPAETSSYRRAHTGIIDISGREILIYLLLDGTLKIFTEQSNFQDSVSISERSFINWPAIVDLNQDSNPDFVFTDNEGQLHAKNRNGGSLNGFPVQPPQNYRFTGSPLIADINGNSSPEVIISAMDQFSKNIYAFDLDGQLMDGFPLYSGGTEGDNRIPINPLIFDDMLISVSPVGDLKIWEFQAMGEVLWRSAYGNSTNNKISSVFLSEPVSIDFSLLNSNETYNWPNPAVDETNIRFQTSMPAEMSIKITTMSGRLIYSNQFQSRGVVPEEIRVDTSSWASGGYFAVVEAKSGNQTERKMINIAVVK